MREEFIRTVDLFCGCGGLALGFDLHEGDLSFRTVLGADNDSAALTVFNNNFRRPGGGIETGRLVDLEWFNHRAEVLLFYLAHLSLWEPDQALADELKDLGYLEFLAQLRSIDQAFLESGGRLWEAEEFKREWEQVARSTTSLALYRSVLARLGLSSFAPPSISGPNLPWTEEYQLAGNSLPPAPKAEVHPSIKEARMEAWTEELGRFRNSAESEGRGQHRTVAGRMAQLVEFLESPSGKRLRDEWTSWRARRDSARASFCLRLEDELEQLYMAGRQVPLVLGGPPCKGWSRIGRAVIEDLRDQGVHAWGSTKYGDQRNALLYKYVLFLDALSPEAFLFENVAHFQSSLRTPSGSVNAASILEEAIEELSSNHLHYRVTFQTVRSRKYGVPQDRNRFIMVGIRDTSIAGDRGTQEFFSGLTERREEVPLKTAFLGIGDPGVVDPYDRQMGTEHEVAAHTLIDRKMPAAHRSYLEWIRQPAPRGRWSPPHVDGHIVRKPRADDKALYEYLAPGKRWMDYKFEGMPTLKLLRKALESALEEAEEGEDGDGKGALIHEALSVLDDSLVLRLLLEAIDPNGQDEDHHLLKPSYLAKGPDNHGDWLERLSPDRPCKTVVAHIGKDTYGYVHPTQPRALSLREAARVQTFPDFFRLQGAGIVDTYSMVGNAVPPLLAHQFAQRFEDLQKSDGIFALSTGGGEGEQLTLASVAAD